MLIVHIHTDNAAFEPKWTHETARILHNLAEKLEAFDFEECILLRDYNGNAAGFAKFEDTL